MHLAAFSGHTETIRFLACCDPSLIFAKDSKKQTTLHYACQFGHQDV